VKRETQKIIQALMNHLKTYPFWTALRIILTAKQNTNYRSL